jgi:hypothetical protein
VFIRLTKKKPKKNGEEKQLQGLGNHERSRNIHPGLRDPGLVFYMLCDLKPVTYPVRTSVSYSVKWAYCKSQLGHNQCKGLTGGVGILVVNSIRRQSGIL